MPPRKFTPEAAEAIKLFREMLADTVKAERKKRGLNQTQLAELAGMTQPRISGIESAKSDIRWSTLVDVLAPFGLVPFMVPEDPPAQK